MKKLTNVVPFLDKSVNIEQDGEARTRYAHRVRVEGLSESITLYADERLPSVPLDIAIGDVTLKPNKGFMNPRASVLGYERLRIDMDSVENFDPSTLKLEMPDTKPAKKAKPKSDENEVPL